MAKGLRFVHKLDSGRLHKPETFRKIFIIVAIVVFILVVLYDLAAHLDSLNQNLFSDISNLIIALYTGFVAVFFTILAIHISMRYGLSSINVLAKKSSGIFAIYFVAILFSVLGLVLSSRTAALSSFSIATPWFIFVTSIPSVVLGVEMAIAVLSTYFFPKYLQETLQITPLEIMKKIGYPDEIRALCQKRKFDVAYNSIGKGLSLIRVCITDLAMRDELEGVIFLFCDAVKSIPWREEAYVGEEYGKKRKQMLFWSFQNRADECIFDPLVNSEIKPPVRIVSHFFCGLAKIYLESNMANSSLFTEYLDGLSRVTEAYVDVGKRDAFGNFLPSTLWAFNEKSEKVSYIEVSALLSKTLALSASLVRKLETKPGKWYDKMYIQFVTSTQIESCLIKYPRAFTRIELENLIFLIEKGDRMFVGNIILAMPFIERELELVKTAEGKFAYDLAVGRFAKLKAKIAEFLLRSRCRLFIEDNSLNIINVDDKTIGSIQLNETLKENLPLLKSFIEKNKLELL